MTPIRSSLAAAVALTLSATLAGGVAAVPASAVGVAQTAPGVVRANDSRAQALVAKAKAVLGDKARQRAAVLEKSLGADGQAALARARSAINADDYVCGPTEFDAWVDRSMSAFTEADLAVLDLTMAESIPVIDAMFFARRGDSAYALTNDAKALTKTFRTLQKFWDVRGDNIDLFAMHGSMLLDSARVSRIYQLLGTPKVGADELATLLAEYLQDPKFQGGNHPIFTLNAFAFTVPLGVPPGFENLSDRIVMGDGLLQAYREMGYGDVAPQAVLAHEYAHQVQFRIGMFEFDAERTALGTRRTELHADASSAYFLSHPRGESMQWKRVQQFLPVFYVIGGCRFEDPDHHGTPNQRLAAATWAYELQEKARPKGHILGAVPFMNQFDAALPALVAPDRR